jgi:general secretion pathway protein D
LKYFFSQENKSRRQTEIIVMLTPHILRMPNIQQANLRGLNTGSETIPRLRGPSGARGSAPAGQPAAATATPVPVPATPAPAPAAPQNPPAPPLRQSNSTVSFSPSPVTLPANGTATVNIVGNGNDFLNVDLTLAFEPGALNIKELREGGFLSRDGQIVAFVQRVETDSGMIRVSLERPPGAAPVSGTGNLVTLVLERGSRPAPSTLRITDFRVRDAQQNAAAGKAAAEVSISAP